MAVSQYRPRLHAALSRCPYPALPNQSEAAAGHRQAAETIAGLLADAAAKLQDLSGQIAQLQHTTTAVPGGDQDDGPTLDTEAVLEWRMPGYSNECRFHIRVFRPAGELPVVVMGQMGDHRSQSIMNCVEEVAAVVAELLLDGAAHDTIRWVQLFPPGQVDGPRSEAGLIQTVVFGKPYGSPDWSFTTHDQLEEVAGGPVRRWHSSDYTLSPPWPSEASRSSTPKPAATGLRDKTTPARASPHPPRGRTIAASHPARTTAGGDAGGDAAATSRTTFERPSTS
jgi:hypothetical protein